MRTPNFNFERQERDRAKAAKKAEKAEAKKASKRAAAEDEGAAPNDPPAEPAETAR